MKKTVNVAAAVIIHDNRILATQRGIGEYEGWWEFPGGKLEGEETGEDAVVREIREELGMEIEVIDLFDRVEYDYPKFRLEMDCFLCTIAEGEPELREHEACRWLAEDEIMSVKWLPADRAVAAELAEDWPGI